VRQQPRLASSGRGRADSRMRMPRMPRPHSQGSTRRCPAPGDSCRRRRRAAAEVSVTVLCSSRCAAVTVQRSDAAEGSTLRGSLTAREPGYGQARATYGQSEAQVVEVAASPCTRASALPQTPSPHTGACASSTACTRGVTWCRLRRCRQRRDPAAPWPRRHMLSCGSSALRLQRHHDCAMNA
jgi:hypothetical protein